ncbi:MAG: ATP-binding protein [Lewinellaceae bacterium]|nr:ATP-binding protein [Lewinellaceae bacterium]
MSQPTREQWTSLNQQYLLAAFELIRLEMASYQLRKEGKEEEKRLAQQKKTVQDKMSQLEEGMAVEPAILTVARIFKLSHFEKQFLLLCAGMELDTELGRLAHELQGGAAPPAITFGLALSALPEGHWSALSPNEPLRYWQLIELEKTRQLTNAPCVIDEHLLHYLLGISQLDHRLHHLIRPAPPVEQLVPSHQQLADELIGILPRFARQGAYPLIQIQGGSGRDNLAIISQAFSTYNLATFYLPLALVPHHFQDLKELVIRWNRTALLNNYALYIDAENGKASDKPIGHQVLYLLNQLQGVVVYGGQLDRAHLGRSLITIDGRKPEQAEQASLWRETLASRVDPMDETIGEITSQFNLDAHSIRNLSKLALSDYHGNGNGSGTHGGVQEQLWKICCEHTRPELDQLGQRIQTRATWEDLVLPEAQKELLRQIEVQVKQRQKVYHTWGFAEKSNRGLGISALFSGESGTGKTMASEVLANALQLDLYRIDLSQVVNKYIGETEKNLKKIFDAAEGSGAILLFDEADALFGKRSEVKDSHDRYSNIEVSYLLQKMEEYKGLAILTTNMKNALDKAFLRRIRFVVQFPFPDAQMREEIWKRIFPRPTPVAALNLKKLASLNVAGGNIRNIALNASFLAAGKGQPVSMQDIQSAAKNEYQKLEKQMSTSESLL